MLNVVRVGILASESERSIIDMGTKQMMLSGEVKSNPFAWRGNIPTHSDLKL